MTSDEDIEIDGELLDLTPFYVIRGLWRPCSVDVFLMFDTGALQTGKPTRAQTANEEPEGRRLRSVGGPFEGAR